MQDRPSPKQLLESVSNCLREEILPKLDARESYRLRIVINALGLVSRQIVYSAGIAEADEVQRLRKLLGEQADVSIDELTAELTRRICSEEIKSDAALIRHLWRTTINKVEVDQPGYAGYRKAIELRDAGTE